MRGVEGREYGEGESCLGADGNRSVVNSQASCVSDGHRMEHFVVRGVSLLSGESFRRGFGCAMSVWTSVSESLWLC